MQGINAGLRELQLDEDEGIVSKLQVCTDVVVTWVLHLVLEPDEPDEVMTRYYIVFLRRSRRIVLCACACAG